MSSPWDQIFYSPPEVVGDLFLNPGKGWVSVIKPIARTNNVINGSFETNTTNWGPIGVSTSVARSTEQQYHGAYSLKVTLDTSPPGDDDGAQYGGSTGLSVTTGNVYAASIKFRAQTPGIGFKFGVGTGSSSLLVSKSFVSTGRWQWIWVIYKENSTATNRQIFILRDGTSRGGSGSVRNAPFYVDGAQFELCETDNYFPTTYIDGDQLSLLPGQFPAPYGWNGIPHASTSYRGANTRDGGQVINLDRFKFGLTGINGLGVSKPSHIVTSRPPLDGAVYRGSFLNPREFQLRGMFTTSTPMDYRLSRQAFGEAINLDSTQPRQPVVLLYQEYDDITPVGDVGKIICSYRDGFDKDQKSTINEAVNISFVQWGPTIQGPESGVSLTTSESISIGDICSIMRRDDIGDWSLITTFASTNSVLDIKAHPDGTVYFTGSFTTIGGTAANRIARYTPSTNTFSALGTGLSGTGRVLRIAPNGDVYVGGGFATAGGVTVNNVARWDGTNWNALGSGGTKGVDSGVNDMAFDGNTGYLYLTGAFLNAGGAGAVRIVRYDPIANSFTALSTGLDGDGESIIVGLGSIVYVNGSFALAGGVACTRIAQWNGTAFSPLGSGTSVAIGTKMRIGSDGSLYIVGPTTAGGITINAIGRWNGSTWFALGTGFDSSANELEFGADGLLYAGGGTWTLVNGIPVSDSFTAWNGSAFILPDLEMPGNTSVSALATTSGGGLYLLFNSSGTGTALASALNTLSNNGTALAYPIIRITGPSTAVTARLYQIRSYTTGEILSFNLLIQPGELITIRSTSQGVIVTSNFRGDITRSIVEGSSLTLTLLRGTNSLAFLSTGGTITATATWSKQYQSVDDLVY